LVKRFVVFEVVAALKQHVEVEATWSVYQAIVAAYRDLKCVEGKTALTKVINSISACVPTELNEIMRLGHSRRPSVSALSPWVLSLPS
jgi:transposase